MPHSVEHSISSLESDSLLPKRLTSSSPLQLPNKWLTNQTTIKSSRSHGNSTIITPRSPHEHEPSKACFRWITTLLQECAIAITEKNPNKTHQLLWLLNELGSPYGDHDQRLAYYFLQALLARVQNLASLWYENLNYVAVNNYYFKTKMDLMLKFQEVSPWTTFGHVASNGVILEALEMSVLNNLHIIDLSNTLCTQWPTLIEALATRYDETPSLRLTLVVTSAALDENFVKEMSQRMEKFARLMCVPFKMGVISGLDALEKLNKDDLGLQDGELHVVNCIQALQRVEVDKREVVLNMINSINPKIITIVEEEANITTSRDDFGKTFEECLRFYGLYFDMLEESFGTISSDRIRLEKERSWDMIRVLGCEDDDDNHGENWRPNSAIEWSNMLKSSGLFHPIQFSNEVVGDIRALLRRYKNDWGVIEAQIDHNNYNNIEEGIHLTWRNEHVVWASAWKPNNNVL